MNTRIHTWDTVNTGLLFVAGHLFPSVAPLMGKRTPEDVLWTRPTTGLRPPLHPRRPRQFEAQPSHPRVRRPLIAGHDLHQIFVPIRSAFLLLGR